eukprot:72850_1
MGICFSVVEEPHLYTSITSKSQQEVLHQQKDLFVLIAGYIRHIHIHINPFNGLTISWSDHEFVTIQQTILMFYHTKEKFLPLKSIDIQTYNSHSSDRSRENSKLLSPPKTPITPASSMRKRPSEEELQLVLEHFKMAETKDFEQILYNNHPNILHFRDQTYSDAKQNQINCKSDDTKRLDVLKTVVEYAYMNIEPPNEYTKQTDRKHFKEVAELSAHFCKNQNIKVPFTLICAAWCHDIERFIPCTKCKYLPESVDKYRKQAIHPITSARIARILFNGGPITSEEMERVYELILRHDIPNPKEDIIILDKMLIQKADDDLLWELQCLMDGDAYAFFESTIPIFINFKSETNSPDWIWERVRNNIKKLRQHLRPRAAECIQNLPKDLLFKMRVNWDELNSLCFMSTDFVLDENINV